MRPREKPFREIWLETSALPDPGGPCVYAKEFGLHPRGSKKTLRGFKHKSNTITLALERTLATTRREGRTDWAAAQVSAGERSCCERRRWACSWV